MIAHDCLRTACLRHTLYLAKSIDLIKFQDLQAKSAKSHQSQLSTDCIAIHSMHISFLCINCHYTRIRFCKQLPRIIGKTHKLFTILKTLGKKCVQRFFWQYFLWYNSRPSAILSRPSFNFTIMDCSVFIYSVKLRIIIAKRKTILLAL